MEEYFMFLHRKQEYSLIDMFNRIVETTNMEIGKKAVQIRADYKGFKAMDALQLAVAYLFCE